MDLEALETCLRHIAHKAAAKELERLLESAFGARSKQPVACPSCGRVMHSVGKRHKRVLTIVGAVRLRRSLYKCSACGAWHIAADAALGVSGTKFSPGARRMMARAGSRSSFAEAQEDLAVYADLEVDAKDIQRVAESVGRQISQWTRQAHKEALRKAGSDCAADQSQPIPVMYVSFDGTGVPVRRSELVGRKGKSADGQARTREVKLGCVFTQTTLDEDGNPVRDPDSTTYTGAIETSEAFGWRIYAEAVARGLERAQKVVVLTDGAAYNKSIIDMHLPDAVHIIDLYHAREHLHELMKLLSDQTQVARLADKWLELLDQGRITEMVGQLKQHVPRSGKRRKEALAHVGYFLENAGRMRYADFSAQGFFVGSGVVEAGCRTLIGQRLKHSGMFWSVSGANDIIASRCCQ